MKKQILTALLLSTFAASGITFAADGFDRTDSYIAEDGYDRIGSAVAADGFDRTGSNVAEDGFDRTGSNVAEDGFDRTGSNVAEYSRSKPDLAQTQRNITFSGQD